MQESGVTKNMDGGIRVRCGTGNRDYAPCRIKEFTCFHPFYHFHPEITILSL